MHFFRVSLLWSMAFLFSLEASSGALEDLLSQKDPSVDGLALEVPAPQKLWQLLHHSDPKSFLKTLSQNHTALVDPDLLRWGSSSPVARTFKSTFVDHYFSHLFFGLVSFARERGLQLSLNTTDLFHGHLLLFQGQQTDLLLVFHAQEYPFDLAETSFNAKAAIKTLQGKKFSHKTLTYKRRNFIWSLRRNHLFNLKTSPHESFHSLIFPEGWKNNNDRLYPEGPTLHQLAVLANTVQDGLLGQGLGSLNFFPQLGAPLYWSP